MSYVMFLVFKLGHLEAKVFICISYELVHSWHCGWPYLGHCPTHKQLTYLPALWASCEHACKLCKKVHHFLSTSACILLLLRAKPMRLQAMRLHALPYACGMLYGEPPQKHRLGICPLHSGPLLPALQTVGHNWTTVQSCHLISLGWRTMQSLQSGLTINGCEVWSLSPWACVAPSAPGCHILELFFSR